MAELRMPDLNMVVIAGNLTNDPTFGETTDKTPVVNFHLASNRRFRDNKGQVKEDVCFVGVVAWDALAKSCKGRLSKGSSVVVSGELQSRKWKSEDGHNRTIVEIKARKIQFLDKYISEQKEEEKNERVEKNKDDFPDNSGEDKAKTNGEAEKMEETDAAAETEPAERVEMSGVDEKKETEKDEFGYRGLEI